MENSHDAGVSGTGPVAETWPEYVRRISGGATQAQIAERIGVGRLSVCNWLRGKSHPKAETVISAARAYRRSPIEALIAACYLNSDEADHPIEIRAALADIDADNLGTEVLRRLTRLENLTAAKVND
jgi:transcriptional regulator with XRE-family HTH domain